MRKDSEHAEWLRHVRDDIVKSIVPKGLKMQIVEGTDLSLTACIQQYNLAAQPLSTLENFEISPFNTEMELCSIGVKWDSTARRYQANA